MTPHELDTIIQSGEGYKTEFKRIVNTGPRCSELYQGLPGVANNYHINQRIFKCIKKQAGSTDKHGRI